MNQINNGAWESGIQVLKSVKVYIPIELLYVCNNIAGKMNGNEFSILTTIERKEGLDIYLSSSYYVPLQEVAITEIDYLPDEGAHNYNVVIHRHPNGMNTFSSVDKEYINQNFELSLLYTLSSGFVNGVYNIKHQGFIIPIDIEPKLIYNIEDVDISKISKKAFTVPTRYVPSEDRDSSYNRVDTVSGGFWIKNSLGEWVPKELEEPKKELPFPKQKAEEEREKEGEKKSIQEQIDDITDELSILEERLMQAKEEWLYGGDNFAMDDITGIQDEIEELVERRDGLELKIINQV